MEDDRRAGADGAPPSDRSSFLEWPRGIARLGVVICTAVALGCGVVYFVKAVDRLGDTARTNAAQNYDDREFAGGNSILVDKGVLYEAQALIPEDETYRVAMGPGVEGPTELTQSFDQYARYFLMPRRPADDARWIICHGCDLSQFGNDLDVLWRNEGGIAFGRLRE